MFFSLRGKKTTCLKQTSTIKKRGKKHYEIKEERGKKKTKEQKRFMK